MDDLRIPAKGATGVVGSFEAIERVRDEARRYLSKRRWDVMLIDAYYVTKEFPLKAKDLDFDESVNIGLKRIRTARNIINTAAQSYEIEYLIAELDGVKFALGGITAYTQDYLNGGFLTTTVSLLIDGKTVITASYKEELHPTQRRQPSFLSVEEFHNNEQIGPLLKAFQENTLSRNLRNEERNKHLKVKKYFGRFTF